MTPAMAQILTELAGESLSLSDLRCVMLVGDVLTRRDLARLRGLAPEARLVNLYGATETQRALSYHEAGETEIAGSGGDRQVLPLGRGMEGCQLLVLNRAGELAGIGELGEICIRSPHLALGYLDDPELTRERFLPNPFGAGDRIYRTGDLGRYLPSGEVEFVTRADNQVKIRGFRIELGEIEARLGRQPGVSEAVAVVRDMVGVGRRVVAYVVPEHAGAVSIDRLRESLKSSLPAYMVPSAFVLMEALPLTPNGKVDRKALPEPEAERPAEDLSETRTPAEELLVGIWCEVLGLEEVGTRQDFFDLGGHSLIATQVVSRVRDVFGVNIPLRWLFESPTVAGLARRIEAARWSEAESAAPLRPVSREGALPLSFSQERLWFLDRLEGGGPVYNIFAAVQLTGRLDAERLRAAFQSLVERHESLRTRFVETGGAPAQVIDPALDVVVPVVDLAHLPAEDLEAEVRARVAAEARHRFDLAAGPLARLSLLRLGDERHALLLNMHHIISDGWSMGVLIRDLAAFYEAAGSGRPAALPELPVQYADYALWQREWLRGEVLESQIAWWRDKLAGAPAVLDLPTDRPRPAVRSQRGALVGAPVAAETAAGLRVASRRAGATTFMTLLAAFQALLSRYSGGEDAPVGSPIAGRTRSELEGLIGFFVNTLVLRIDLAGNPTFAELLERARETTLGAYAHQDLPFEKLVEELAPRRDLSYSPLFQVMLTLQNAPPRPIDLPGLRLEPLGSETGTAKFDLSLSLREVGETLGALLEYDLDLFDEATARRIAGHFQTLLAGAAADPGRRLSELPLLSSAEAGQIAAWTRGLESATDERCVHELFEAQADLDPEAVAVVAGSESLTYGELEVRANRLARRLQKLGVGPEVRVALSLPRSPEGVVAVMAILKAGGVYLPLDPAYPRERRSWMLEDSGARVLVTRESLRGDLPVPDGVEVLCLDDCLDDSGVWDGDASRPVVRVFPENLAYVIYTSGSTGLPKGVGVGHGIASRHLRGAMASYGVRPGVRVLQTAAWSFDVSIDQILGTLIAGGSMALWEGDLDPVHLRSHVETMGVTYLDLTPAFLQLWVRMMAGTGEPDLPVQIVQSGGDVLAPEVVRLWPETPLRNALLLNGYGPTEAVVGATLHTVATGTSLSISTVPIGRPLPERTAHVLESDGQPAPVGVPGELVLGGLLAQGYLGRPDATAEKFVPDPFSAIPGARLYRTGDKVRWLASGELEFLGRIDQQVKIRGFRIEPGEIETALTAHPAVAQAAVVAVGDGDRRLVAFLVPREAEVPEAGELRTLLGRTLPAHMVPSAFVTLPALPLTPAGKIDRRALARMAPAPEARETYVAPSTPVEEILAGIWATVLRVERVGAHDDFFELGGHSLLGTQVQSRVREALEIELPLRKLFEAPTVAALALEIEGLRRGVQAPPIRRVPRDGDLPLSFAQERLWFLDQLQPGSAAYNVPVAVRLEGGLDAEALEATLREIVRRHEALRTSFALRSGRPVQVVASETALFLPVVDLTGLEPEAREAGLRTLAASETLRPFDLRRSPLLRALLIRLAGEDHALVLTLHHIASDGWSTGVLIREMLALYQAFSQGLPSPLPELPVQYADFAVWQREWLRGEVLEGQLAWWRDLLAGAPVLQLATDRPRSALQTFEGSNRGFALPAGAWEGVRNLARAQGATPFMVLLAGFEALLHRYTGQDDLIVGTTIANRTRSELEGLIGFFINTLALRADLTGDPGFAGLVARTRERALGAYAHQDVPFEKLVAELQPDRDLSRSPLFQVVFQLQNAPMESSVKLPGLALRPVEGGGQTAKFDLVLNLTEVGSAFTGVLKYNTGLFEAATAARIVRHFGTLLTGGLAEPGWPLSSLPLLSAVEVQQLVLDWNDAPAEDLGVEVLHERFAAQAARQPQAVAVVCDGESLTYGDLDRRANQIANHLVGLGVVPGDLVGLRMERSLEMVTAILGVLKAGAAYVPLDPAYPEERLAYMIEDSGVQVVLTSLEGLAGEVSDPRVPVSAEHPAYVIYTSGSTGRPKGVVVRHGNVARLFSATDRWFGFGAEDVWTLFHSYAFDFSVWEIWGALLYGGRLVVVPYWISRSPEAFHELLREERVTVLNQTPSAFRQLIWAGEGKPADLALRYVVFGGEALEPASLAPWFERYGDERPRLINMYGITETTVHVTYREISAKDVASAVGCPIPDLGVYLLDPSLNLVPVGVPGEILVGGAGLALGYLDRAELTAERFIPNPFGEAGSRLYRSGDLARRLPDGDLEYLGRIDHQVKMRGFRIELGEIEAALVRHPAIREAVVLVREDRLVAWVVAEEEVALSDLRAFAGESLPEYMLPSALVMLDKLPLTANGKVDRRALPDPDAPVSAGFVAPRTPLETFVAGLFQEVLGIERIGVHDDFFEMGGNSISGAVLINRLQQELGQIVQVVVIFDHPTVESMAAYLEAEHLAEGMESERIDEEKLARFATLVEPLATLTPPRKNRRAVFVLSPPRSGSTLLRVMLGGHPKLFAPPELELLSFNTLRERGEAFSGRDSFWLEGAIRAVMEIRGCGPDEARAIIEELETEDLTTAAFYGRLQEWLGDRVLVDKTPSYALDPAILRQAETVFEEPLYIHLIRHPGGMIRSFVEAKLDQIFFRKEHDFSRRELAELIWVASHRNIESFLEGVPARRQHWVRFEDLLREPEAVLRGICGFLGLEYDPAMAEPYQKGSSRMTDGPYAESRMLGDVKFHEHSGVDAAVAERWREEIPESSLGEPTRAVAERLGYDIAFRAWSPIVRRVWTEENPAPLSFAQERLWFLDQLNPGQSAYNVPFALRMSGRLDVPALAGSLGEIVRRHAVLRTTFPVAGGRPVQKISQENGFTLPVVDLAGVAGREAEMRSLVSAESQRPFDLARGPMLRGLLIRLGEDEHVAVLNLHHIVSDGWSVGVLVREVTALYEAFRQGRPSPLPELPIQYADFSAWQRERLQGEELDAEIAWWRERLSDAAFLELPTDRPRPRVQAFQGAVRTFSLSRETSEALAALSQAEGATLFMTLMTAFLVLLQRYSGREDVLAGTTTAGRNRTELEGLIGFFVNTLALRADLSGGPGFLEALRRVRRAVLGAFAHQELPFEKVVEEVQPERDLSRSPLFSVMLQLQNASSETLELPGLVLRPVPNKEGQTSKFDLVLNFTDSSRLAGVARYNSGLFDAATAARWLRHLESLLTGIVADPQGRIAELPMLSAAEIQQLARDWNDAPVEDLGVEVLHARFAAQAARRPEAVAAVCAGESLTYGDLDRRANQIANHLVGLGVVPGDLVGLQLERSLEMVVAILGVLKAGAAYVPLDPAYPAERLDFMVEDSGVSIVLTEEILATVEGDVSDPRVPVSAEHPAYVIYTSGSTGRPKGVVVRHGNVTRLFSSTDHWFGFGPEDVWTLFHSYAFDFSVWEIWGALLYGGRLVVVPYWVSRSPESFHELLRDERVTVLNQTPSAFRQLIWAGEGKPADLALSYVIFGGEALEPASLAPWFVRYGDERPRLINMYGITETTVHVTYREVRAQDTVSAVGCPIPDLGVYLLDPTLNLVPVGVPGEILVGGAGLALGYLNRPELTAERFIPNPFGEPGSRLYRSGDLARRLSDGDLEYLGRIDHQVKIRGFRIELGEIEAAVARHPAVRETVVLVRDEKLVAWVAGEEITLSDLRAFVGASLPDHMLPSALVVLDKLPLTANGKVDRRALPDPEAPMSVGYVAPRTSLESFVARLFQEVLGIEKVGVHDNFFELGGNSITGAVLINRLQQELGQIVQVVVIFDYPTVESMAAYLEAEHLAGAVEAERIDEDKLARFATLVEPLAPIRLPRKNSRAIFVLSPPRSGSTLLRVMLGGHPKLFAPPELELLSFNTLRERSEAFSGRDSFWLEGAIRAVMEIRGCGPDEARSIIEELEAEDLTTAAFYGRLQDWLGDRILVDKTPSYALDPAVLKRAEEAFEEPLYIHLIRHPGGMIRSFVEAKLDQIFFRKEHGFSRRELAELIWVASHRNIESFLESVPARRQHWVRFEDLLREPEAVLRGVCGFLGLDYDPAMTEPYRKDSARMTDGPYAESRMLGDVKFHEHSGVDAAVAERWREEIPESSLGEPTREVASRLGYEIAAATAWSPIVRKVWMEDDLIPLSFAQERLWILDQLDPGKPTYNVPTALRMRGPLDVPALAASLREIVRRHDALRTRFAAVGDRPVQKISPALDFTLPVVDLAGIPITQREPEAKRVVTAEARRPFDLAAGPLVRGVVFHLDAEDYAVVFTLHHIISDGWSMGVLVREVAALYGAFREGRPSPLRELAVQYADFAAWQREWLRGAVLEAQIAYWRDQLTGAPALELPTDRPRPPVQRFKGATRPLFLSRETSEALAALGQAEGATMFMTLAAAFQTLLHRYSGQDDVSVGSPVAGRNRAEVEELIGFFVNTLVLRTDLSGSPDFLGLLGRVRRGTLDAFAHQELPFEKVVEELQPERDLSRSPLFQVMFALQNASSSKLDLPGLTLSRWPLGEPVAKFDLSLAMSEGPEGLSGSLEYSVDLFDRSTIDRTLGHFRVLLNAIVSDPRRSVSELPLLTGAERDQLLGEWNATDSPVPESCVHEGIAARAAASPEAAAVVFGADLLTYRELDQRANALAHRLRELGVGPEVRVGVALERSLEMVIGLLAVLKAGGAYVPLDPSYPAERLAFMLEDAGVAALLTQSGLAGYDGPEIRLSPGARGVGESAEPPAGGAGPWNLAYVIYTSGSTGRPKGVQISHGALTNFLASMAETPGFGTGDVLLAVTSLSFDIAGLELYLPLLTGGQVILASREEAADGRRLQELIAASGATILQATPATWRLLLESGWPGGEGLKALCGGEALPPALAASLRERVGSLWNVYGPTETTVWSTVEEVAGDGPVSIGRPIANTAVYVVDAWGSPAPVGVPGELYLGGAGLARGYLARPELTAERFLPDPFGAAGSRIYRTGDLARYRPDGRLECLGRIDHQVKVRGFRIELGEIEAVLGRHPEVAAAVVVAREDVPGDRRLAAYVVPRQAGADLTADLRIRLRQSLPEYMVPTAWVAMDALPLTPNGKVDRRALPKPEAVSGEVPAEPRTPVEELLTGMWSELLGRESVGIHDNFFDLGGHSLKATQVVARVRQAFGVDLPLRRVFEAPTVAGLARIVERLRSAAGPEAPPILPVSREGEIPLSFSQQRVWVLDQLEVAGTAYHLRVSVRLRGRLDAGALEMALGEVVCRHESLRTVFASAQGRPWQVVQPRLYLAMPRVDLSVLPEGVRNQEARRVAEDLVRLRFDLSRGPLLRTVLVAVGPAEHLFDLVIHHIVADGWSLGVFIREVAAFYRAFVEGSQASLAPLPVQYPDFAAWQREWLQGEVLAEQLAYWRGRLSGLPPVLQLAPDKPRRVGRAAPAGRSRVALSEGLSEALRDLGRREQATPFMILLAGFATLLHRYTGQPDIAVGTPIANRGRIELEGLIGFFANTLVLRSDLGGAPGFAELLDRVRTSALDAYAHQDLPFERLVEELQPERNLAVNPLFQVMFQMQNVPVSQIDLPGLALLPAENAKGSAMFDLTLAIRDTGGGFGGGLEYDSDLFEAVTIQRFVGHWVSLLSGAVADPACPVADLPLLSAAERHQTLVEWSDTETDYPVSLSVLDLVEEQVARTPEAVAVSFQGVRLTYRELDHLANRLSGALARHGVAAEARVGVCLERTPAMVAALLAVWKAGAAYVPMDPFYPEDRLAYMLEDAGIGLLMADAATPASLAASAAAVVRVDREVEGEGEGSPRVGAESLAYVIYTSGSTGRPKGVEISHGALVNFLYSMSEAPGLEAEDPLLAVTSLSFDIAGLELFLPLIQGARIELASRETAADGPRLLALLRESGATVLQATPVTWQMLVEAGWSGGDGLKVLCGGEALPERLAAELCRRSDSVWNLYGPTETTIWSAARRVRAEERVVVGPPIANTGLYVLDARLRPAPSGVPGELWIGGLGLARGYHDRPDLTAERFLPDPFAERPGGRMYRTGDLVRFRPDGALEFLGRADHQVKVRGFRIELGEIEAALEANPAIERAVVMARGEEGARRLVAWLVPREKGTPSALSVADLREGLARTLPDYMVPSAWMVLDALPLTPNGKVDRRALPSPEGGRPEAAAYVPPGNAVEELLAGIWAEALGLERVGALDNFFVLGGHSLLATQVVSRAAEALEMEVPLRRLFEAPTVAGMAAGLLRQAPSREDLERSARLVLDLLQLSEEEVDSLLLGQDGAGTLEGTP
ncbi:MAG TPA: non-ribosomal peptide synthase/polyketide synthase [Thermoanaerobaculia bacterium]